MVRRQKQVPKKYWKCTFKFPSGSTKLELGFDLLDAKTFAFLQPRRICLLADRNVREKAEPLAKALGASLLVMRAGESAKTLKSAGKVYEFLYNAGMRSQDALIVMGGGTVGDLGLFVASTYMRGRLRCIMVPTTVLAAADSSLGGKSALHVGWAKNVIGTYFHPEKIVCDCTLFQTLSERDFASGFTEIAKTAIISDKIFFSRLHEAAFSELLFQSLSWKAHFVAQDEHDHGARQYLNFGHTLGHALESATHHKMSHGEAVRIGMRYALRLSVLLNYLSWGQFERIDGYFGYAQADLPPWEEVHMQQDKKQLSKKGQDFVLLRGIGKPCIKRGVSEKLQMQAYDWLIKDFA